MNKILLFKHSDGSIYAWDISTKQLRENAYLLLFAALDELNDYDAHTMEVTESQLCTMARHGNGKAAMAFLLLTEEEDVFEEVDMRPNEVRSLSGVFKNPETK